jgi:S1-C subfamily serine protease
MQRHPYDDPDFEFTPLRPASAAAAPAIPAPAAATPAATTSATSVGESAARPDRTPSSSGPISGRRLAGVAVVSILSASIATVATIGVLGVGSLAAVPSGSETAGGSQPQAVTVDEADAAVEVAEKASPAVVTITTESAGDSFGPYSMPATGVGSGFVFDADGLILTNNHVVEGGDQFTVTFQDGTALLGRVVATDPRLDLAVVSVNASDLPTIEIGDSSSLRVGQMTVAIGSPLGTFTESVTRGILSAVDRSIEVGDPNTRRTSQLSGLLQTDTAINPGNSGGPLLDSTGRAIGVNVAGTMGAEGIGFAVPIDAAAQIMAEARGAVTGA